MDAQIRLYDRMVFGGLAGFSSTTLIYPIDTLRTRIQVHGFEEALKKVRLTQMYNGFGFNLLYVIPEKAFKFGVNDYVLHKLNQNSTNPTISTNKNRIIAGMTAGFFQSFITSPAELLKIRMQRNKDLTLKNAYRSVPNIYRGLSMTIARDIPFTGIFFPAYYGIRRSINVSPSSIFGDIVAGLGAGISATTLVTPFDVVKTKYQASNSGTIYSVIKNTYNEGGPSAFIRGIVPRTFSIAVLYSLTISVFEFQKRFMKC